MNATKTKADLERDAKELAASWVMTATNEGTYSPHEALDKVGCGDPAYANWHEYTQVGSGQTKTDGPCGDRMPGRVRRSFTALAERQRELKDIRAQMRAS